MIGADSSALEEIASYMILRAKRLIENHYLEERHQIGAVVLDLNGSYHDGIHLEAMIGRASSCAEASALANAVMAGARGLSMAVAVRHPKPSEAGQIPKIVSPCGLCRELLLDYAPDVLVVLQANEGFQIVRLADILPHKYVGTKWNHEAGTAGSRQSDALSPRSASRS
ncbi:hypothetical protein IU470_25825 [Nocardia abscessus]|uniref:CMP/dCMP-type deaminase domain-containing protein n=1 Tax=Nocardia abscessus TaxID=120957 RepID=A0ABS0CG86_9NOCA|nr:hypothetical protein [Nocardia abscessus]MBF6228513.1 hypothetical protein [Nocardia abscessus]